MGLFDELDDEELEMMTTHKDFEPLELTEGNVNAIFNRCVYEEGKPGEPISSEPFRKEYGYSSNNDRTLLITEDLIKNKANIIYLVGQIKGIAEKKEIALSDLAISYQNLAWTRDIECVLRLVNLCCNRKTAILFQFDNRQGQNASMILKKIEPTLSPKDPKFPEWYEGYKARHPEIDFGD